MSEFVDSDWLIDAVIGVPTAVSLLAGRRGDGLAVSIFSYGELFAGTLRAPDPSTERALPHLPRPLDAGAANTFLP